MVKDWTSPNFVFKVFHHREINDNIAHILLIHIYNLVDLKPQHIYMFLLHAHYQDKYMIERDPLYVIYTGICYLFEITYINNR